MKEFFRKKIVFLKRNPQVITLVLAFLCCLVYSIALGTHSQAAVTFKYSATYVPYEYGTVLPALYRNMGLLVFILMLLSVLSVITYMSSYKKGKVRKLMFSLSLLMFGAMIVCDIIYVLALNFYISPEYGMEDLDGYAAKGISNCIFHAILLVITFASALLTPVYGKLLAKINTTVEDPYDKLMEQKSEEELMIELDENA